MDRYGHLLKSDDHKKAMVAIAAEEMSRALLQKLSQLPLVLGCPLVLTQQSLQFVCLKPI